MRSKILYTALVLLLIFSLFYTRTVEITPVNMSNGLRVCIFERTLIYKEQGFENPQKKAQVTCTKLYNLR